MRTQLDAAITVAGLPTFTASFGVTDSEPREELAAALDLDVPRFICEMSDHLHAARVREDFRSGVRSGVNGTPTFFINGVRHDGPFDLRTLLAAIEEAV